MITQLQLTKYFTFVKKHLLHLVGIIVAFVISNTLSSYEEKKLSEYENAENMVVLTRNFTNNKCKLQFALQHRFNGESRNFEQFISQAIAENFAQISSIEYVGEPVSSLIKRQKTIVHGIFWHDMFIFTFLNTLMSFSPGFLRILSVDICKFAEMSLLKPVLKVDIVCELFQKP
ncbi:MAG: hypothetical protein LBB34_04845 [Holosporales bacterium]|jgi:hypothetical protein|nr:hypothetical protein [Holosporales bacterium]